MSTCIAMEGKPYVTPLLYATTLSWFSTRAAPLPDLASTEPFFEHYFHCAEALASTSHAFTCDAVI